MIRTVFPKEYDNKGNACSVTRKPLRSKIRRESRREAKLISARIGSDLNFRRCFKR